ncbi:pathogenesis-related protein 1-like [Spinacia oleracea]|uniref:Pathogenesis-related protein 1-like n=1 Tax=Spinacia oleracea TaxID=3562 RepID=A0ABM3RH31_SPIOL|nr:pathogenesis-related protein 1-like [Spinacia oleracea]
MTISKFSLAIILISGLIMDHICWASSLSDSEVQFLTLTNAVRVKALQPPLVWNTTLADFASSYAKKRVVDCKLQHSKSPIYGESIATSPKDLSPAEAVDLWANKIMNYYYGSDTCQQMCAHYTRIVWKIAQSIGCAREKCQNGGTFITCNYYPPGNVVGE